MTSSRAVPVGPAPAGPGISIAVPTARAGPVVETHELHRLRREKESESENQIWDRNAHLS
jgi:hypothetical protein